MLEQMEDAKGKRQK